MRRRVFLSACFAWTALPGAVMAQVNASGDPGVWAAAKLLISLLIVIAAIFAAAWALKRLGPTRTAGGLIRVLAAVPIGPRERLVLVEIGETWFVLGVAPGHIQTLHSMPKQPGMFDNPQERIAWLTRWRS